MTCLLNYVAKLSGEDKLWSLGSKKGYVKSMYQQYDG